MSRQPGVRAGRPPHPWHSLQTRLLLWMFGAGLVTVAVVLLALNQGTSRQFEQFVTRNNYSTLYQGAIQVALARETGGAAELRRVAEQAGRLHDIDIRVVEPDGTVIAASEPAALNQRVLLPDLSGEEGPFVRLVTRDGSLGMLYLLPAAAEGLLGKDLVSQTPEDPTSWRTPRELFPSISIRSEITFVQEVNGVTETSDGTVVQSRTLLNQSIPLTPLDNQALFRGGLSRTVALTAAGALLLILALSLVMTRQILRPIRALTTASRQMQAGRLGSRVPLSGRDELGELALAFNSMAAQMEENIAALQRFVGDAAHELHTPLTALRTNLELAASEPDDGRRAGYLRRADRLIERLTHVTRDLLDLSTLEATGPLQGAAPVDLVPLLREASELHASRAQQAGIRFDLDLPPEPVRVLGDRNALRQALANLIDNAIKFTPPEGTVRVTLAARPDGVTVTVRDNGIGIGEADLPRLFDRFYRAGNAAPYPGSGLGLAIVRAVAEQHAGRVHAAATPDGSTFTLYLAPAAASGRQ